jgi:polyketide cyclase/dehydrase/lipid transport protein
VSRAVELTVAVDVDAPVEDVWAAVTDWPGQGEWMLGTVVRVDGEGDGRRLGARLTAVTGAGPAAFSDPMEIVEWDPPRRCVVRHLGSVVRGKGVFEVVELAPGRAQFVWSELLELPLGPLGRLGWPLVRPAFRLGVRVSLERMARQVAARRREQPGERPGG